jgi:hypothetical protein
MRSIFICPIFRLVMMYIPLVFLLWLFLYFSGTNPEGEEADQSCGGESCTDDEKEDSWTDEEEDE